MVCQPKQEEANRDLNCAVGDNNDPGVPPVDLEVNDQVFRMDIVKVFHMAARSIMRERNETGKASRAQCL